MHNLLQQYNKQAMGCETQLAWKAHSRPLSDVLGEFSTSELHQTGLVLGMSPGFISRSGNGRLQVSVCTGAYVLPWWTIVSFFILNHVTMKSRSNHIW